MDKILFDTNIIMDWLLERDDFYETSTKCIELCKNSMIQGFLTLHSISDIFYFLRKERGLAESKELIILLVNLFYILANELRKKVAAEWTELNQVEITPEMINCVGCRVDGVKTPFCDSLCQIRQCGLSKKFETCGSCGELMTCEKVQMIIGNNKEALENLKG